MTLPTSWDGRRSVTRRIVFALTVVLTLVVVAGIVLVLTDAPLGNTVVARIVDTAHWLVGPFRRVVPLSDYKQEVALNWGVTAIVYFLVGLVLSRTITSR